MVSCLSLELVISLADAQALKINPDVTQTSPVLACSDLSQIQSGFSRLIGT